MESKEKIYLSYIANSNAVKLKSISIEKKQKKTLEMLLTFFHIIKKPIASPLFNEIGLSESFVSFL
jgi:hypothetical protein